VLDPEGRVVGVECSTFPTGSATRLHAALAKLAIATPATVSVGPLLPSMFAGLRALERRAMRETLLVEARHGVVITTRRPLS
jgi:hypothetical protein